VTATDGGAWPRRRATRKASPGNPLTSREVEQKSWALAAGALVVERCDRVLVEVRPYRAATLDGLFEGLVIVR